MTSLKPNKLTCLILTLMATSAASGITSDEAIAFAKNFLQRETRALHHRESEWKSSLLSPKIPDTYIVTTGDKGFMVVSGEKGVVAYIPDGNYTSTPLPTDVETYFSYIADAVPGTYDFTANGWAPVEPLCTSKWSQRSPYDGMCPEFDGKRSAVGCLATGLAQIMKCHEWPPRGEGTHGGVDFNIDYKWDQIKDSYPSDTYTEEEANAVAALCWHVGVASDMQYSSTVSSAAVYKGALALLDHFLYDKSMNYVERAYYTDDDWYNIIYHELSVGRPVFYSGYSDGEEVGHGFICDGYLEEDFFHINWGWGGDWNGYFRLDLLNPYNKEKPLFAYRQDAIINIKPDEGGESLPGMMGATNSLRLEGETLNFGTTYDGVKNIRLTDIECRFGLEFTSSKYRFYVEVTEDDVYYPQYGELSFTLRYPEGLVNDVYAVRIVYRRKGSDTWEYPIYPQGATERVVVKYNEGTGVETMSAPEEKEEPIFDLTGKRLKERPSEGNIYITNGKKTLSRKK